MKFINETVDEARRGEVEAEPLLRKARYVLFKNRMNLTEKQRQPREVLEELVGVPLTYPADEGCGQDGTEENLIIIQLKCQGAIFTKKNTK